MTIQTLSASIGDRDGTYEFDFEWEVTLPDDFNPMLIGLLQKGFGEILRDATSTCKAKNAAGQPVDPTPAQREAAALERLGKIKAGTYEFGRGGAKSPRLTIEQQGWCDFFNSKETNVKFNKEKANSNNLDKYLSTYVNNVLQPQIRAYVLAQKMDVDTQRTWREKELPALIAKKRPAIVAAAEKDTGLGKPGWYIEQERIKRTPKGTEQATDISLFDE